jgi:hypothetical protein
MGTSSEIPKSKSQSPTVEALKSFQGFVSLRLYDPTLRIELDDVGPSALKPDILSLYYKENQIV